MFDELKPHLVELRKRLAISVLSLLFFFIVAFVFYEPVLTWVIQPLKDALPEGGQATTHQVGGVFFIALKVSFFASIIFSLPIILWQIWLFVAPALFNPLAVPVKFPPPAFVITTASGYFPTFSINSTAISCPNVSIPLIP